MKRQRRDVTRPRGARVLLPLVLAVVAGVLAMHGLASADTTAGHDAAPTSHAMTAMAPDCVQPEHDGGGHMDHADATCAAAGIGSAPALPALPVAVTSVGPVTPVDGARHVSGAPPGGSSASLSELQLLRI
ncbi:DUF6153 family protein [Streptomyces sp. NRRL F-5135]|uniref:DUF6153 family protein n=1 Tax=Streptomyces sp. NRRL F-5135 TaxID=1463858 RepID=UPI0004CAD4CE|nr:DUF6153 family protein [Streptomyces sp. NRRL F-5135]